MPPFGRKSWTKPKAVVTAGGHRVRSGFEKKIVESLEVTLRDQFGYESDRIPYTIEHHYIPDIRLPGGIFVEVKGGRSYANFPSSDRTKLLTILKQQPDIDIRLVFEHPHSPISKTSKTTKAQWCDKHDIPWAHADIPKEWVHESPRHRSTRTGNR